MNHLQLYTNEKFGTVRTLLIGNEPYFVGKDVADILGYSNNRKALLDHVEEDDRLDGVTVRDAIGREQTPVLINESGLYSLILSSRLPEAKRFKHWITSEVLPSLRKHGVYAHEELLNDPDLLMSALEALKKERDRKKELQDTVDAQQRLLTAMEPKAEYFDRVLSCPEAMPISIIAKDYGWSACRMNRFLHCCGIQYRVGKSWLLYAEYAGKGFTRSETVLFTGQNGETRQSVFTKWTQKGRMLIYELMKAAGYEPLTAQEEADVCCG